MGLGLGLHLGLGLDLGLYLGLGLKFSEESLRKGAEPPQNGDAVRLRNSADRDRLVPRHHHS